MRGNLQHDEQGSDCFVLNNALHDADGIFRVYLSLKVFQGNALLHPTSQITHKGEPLTLYPKRGSRTLRKVKVKLMVPELCDYAIPVRSTIYSSICKKSLHIKFIKRSLLTAIRTVTIGMRLITWPVKYNSSPNDYYQEVCLESNYAVSW